MYKVSGLPVIGMSRTCGVGVSWPSGDLRKAPTPQNGWATERTGGPQNGWATERVGRLRFRLEHDLGAIDDCGLNNVPRERANSTFGRNGNLFFSFLFLEYVRYRIRLAQGHVKILYRIHPMQVKMYLTKFTSCKFKCTEFEFTLLNSLHACLNVPFWFTSCKVMWNTYWFHLTQGYV